MSEDIVDRLRRSHTLQYGWLVDRIVRHTEDDPNPNIRERMNRCAVCEQWSPCDGRQAADVIERLRETANTLAIQVATREEEIERLRRDVGLAYARGYESGYNAGVDEERVRQ